MNKDIENLKNIIDDLEDAESGAIISLSQEEINSLKSILESYVSKDKIRKKIDKLETYRQKHYYFRKDLSKAQHDKSMKMWGAICCMKELLEEE